MIGLLIIIYYTFKYITIHIFFNFIFLIVYDSLSIISKPTQLKYFYSIFLFLLYVISLN